MAKNILEWQMRLLASIQFNWKLLLTALVDWLFVLQRISSHAMLCLTNIHYNFHGISRTMAVSHHLECAAVVTQVSPFSYAEHPLVI